MIAKAPSDSQEAKVAKAADPAPIFQRQFSGFLAIAPPRSRLAPAKPMVGAFWRLRPEPLSSALVRLASVKLMRASPKPPSAMNFEPLRLVRLASVKSRKRVKSGSESLGSKKLVKARSIHWSR
eukprot:scaffold62521_cov59-Phaeocystis_antarctica.AAC.4